MVETMRKLKVGIIGQGRSGRDIHAFSLGKLADHYTIAAISDPLEERRQRAEKELGCDTYNGYKELFTRNDLDLIVNATPSHLHVPVSLECLEHGFNVLCEKPLARRAAEVDKLIDASKKMGKTLAIYQQSRYSPAFQKIREIIASGNIGRVVQAGIAYNGFARRWDWQTLQERNGGNLMNTGPHPVDQALQLFGTDVMPKVTCLMDRANSFGDAEDYVKLILSGSGRPTIDVEISSCCAYPSGNYNIQGTLGGIKGSTNHLDWKYYRPAEAPAQHLVTEPLTKADGTPTYCGEELKWYEESWDMAKDTDLFNTMSSQFYTMLYNTLANGEPLKITPHEVRQQISVIEQCFNQNPEFTKNHTF
jgi:scyllo-inositol 2-dehydrogenase (NADP+)